MAAQLRRMSEDYLERIGEIDRLAYTEYYKGLGRISEPRTRANLESLLYKDPEGCFVIVDNGKIMGYSASRSWGSVGWSGLAVLPGAQGRGLGKLLMHASIDYLESVGCEYIGLQTMVQNEYNLGFYLGLGYRPDMLTIRVARKLDSVTQQHGGELVVSPLAPEDLPETIEITDMLLPGLDLTKEIRAFAEFSMGETLAFRERGRLICFATLRYRPSKGSAGDTSVVEFLALRPGSEGRFATIIGLIEEHLKARSFKRVVIPVFLRYYLGLAKLISMGYKVYRGQVLMLREGEIPDRDHILCWQWSY